MGLTRVSDGLLEAGAAAALEWNSGLFSLICFEYRVRYWYVLKLTEMKRKES